MSEIVWVYVVIFVAGFLATDVWRVAGVVMSAKLDETSPVLRWVKAVSTALVAGLIAKLVLYPPGELADVSVLVRLLAVVAGCLGYFATRGSVFLGVVASELVLVGSTYFVGAA